MMMFDFRGQNRGLFPPFQPSYILFWLMCAHTQTAERVGLPEGTNNFKTNCLIIFCDYSIDIEIVDLIL
jgi:hypothetical protein